MSVTDIMQRGGERDYFGLTIRHPTRGRPMDDWSPSGLPVAVHHSHTTPRVGQLHALEGYSSDNLGFQQSTLIIISQQYRTIFDYFQLILIMRTLNLVQNQPLHI